MSPNQCIVLNELILVTIIWYLFSYTKFEVVELWKLYVFDGFSRQDKIAVVWIPLTVFVFFLFFLQIL